MLSSSNVESSNLPGQILEHALDGFPWASTIAYTTASPQATKTASTAPIPNNPTSAHRTANAREHPAAHSQNLIAPNGRHLSDIRATPRVLTEARTRPRGLYGDNLRLSLGDGVAPSAVLRDRRRRAPLRPGAQSDCSSHSVTPADVSEMIITHLAFYAVRSEAVAAVAIAKDVFAQRGIDADQMPAASPRLLGTASGVLNTCRQLGGALAVAVFGAWSPVAKRSCRACKSAS